MKKIVRIVTRLNIGGPAIHTVLLTRGMASMGYETILVAGSCEPDEGDMSYLLDDGVNGDRVHWIPQMSRSVSPGKNIRALWRLWRLMRKERPLIVHTHTAMAGSLGRAAAILSGVPIIIHTFHGNSLRHYFSPLMSRVFLTIERMLARATDAICVVSQQQAEELSGEFRVAPLEKFRVIPLGLNLDAFLEMALPTPADRGLTVGWLGRLAAVKNVPLLVAVIEETLRRTDRINFRVAGDGSDAEMLRHAVSRFGERVVWRGWERDVQALISRCHVLLQTSHNEGTPVALIQGMAAGRPFLSTPVGGVVDMAHGSGNADGRRGTWFSNAVLADPDPVVFADVLIEFLQSPERVAEMGRHARQFAAGRYAKERLFENLHELYGELSEKRSAAALPRESARL